jgi:hypothetical protein
MNLSSLRADLATGETLSSDIVQSTVTTSLEQDEIEVLATALKLASSTVQNYFPHTA